jgi:outer membrane protein OmpA-like peptidoglycan-associated protein
MKTIQLLIIAVFVLLYTGCTTMAPKELVNARTAYQLASKGPAAQLAPVDLHKAQQALDLAEQSFKNDSDSYKTKDLAYVAQRKAELAEARGIMAADKAIKEKADIDFQKQQGEIVKQGRQDLIESEKRTADAQTELDRRAAVKEVQDKADADLRVQQIEIANKAKQDLIDSEKRTADALAELAKLASIKEEERGLVITLSGGVLFRFDDSNLLSSAKVKLDQVATALLAVKARNIIIEGHTDSQGSETYNQGLSQRRSDTVRDYLVQKGYPVDRIQSHGMGMGSPIADNSSPEGRANNRRVEIIIENMQLSNR